MFINKEIFCLKTTGRYGFQIISRPDRFLVSSFSTLFTVIKKSLIKKILIFGID